MSSYYVANAMGDSRDRPTRAELRTLLEELDPEDEEHGAAWCSTDDGLSLEYDIGGRMVFDRAEGYAPVHLKGVSKERALEIWLLLVEGRRTELDALPWVPGHGHVPNPEQLARFAEAELEQARAAYDALGPERGGTRCKAEGCERGTVQFSVFCRPHHIESLAGTPSRFTH